MHESINVTDMQGNHQSLLEDKENSESYFIHVDKSNFKETNINYKEIQIENITSNSINILAPNDVCGNVDMEMNGSELNESTCMEHESSVQYATRSIMRKTRPDEDPFKFKGHSSIDVIVNLAWNN